MPYNTLLLPPSNQFWAQCACHLIKMMRPNGVFYKGHATLSEVDFSILRFVMVNKSGVFAGGINPCLK